MGLFFLDKQPALAHQAHTRLLCGPIWFLAAVFLLSEMLTLAYHVNALPLLISQS